MLIYMLLFQETARRLLHFTVARVVAVSPQMRLVQDNSASVSLLDIYKQVILSFRIINVYLLTLSVAVTHFHNFSVWQ